MHWTTLLLLLLPTPISCLTTARIQTTFQPRCPPTSPLSRPGDLDLNEQFTTALTIRSGVCQPVPVPFPYTREVDYVSVSVKEGEFLKNISDADNNKDKAKDQRCVVSVYEVAGCVGEPLIQRRFGKDGEEGRVESECRQRRFGAWEVWVRFDCFETLEGKISHGLNGENGVHANKNENKMAFGGYTNSTASGNRTLARRTGFHRRRLSFLGV